MEDRTSGPTTGGPAKKGKRRCGTTRCGRSKYQIKQFLHLSLSVCASPPSPPVYTYCHCLSACRPPVPRARPRGQRRSSRLEDVCVCGTARHAFLRAWTAFFESRALAVAVFLSSSDVIRRRVYGTRAVQTLFPLLTHAPAPRLQVSSRARHLLCDHPRGQISFSV